MRWRSFRLLSKRIAEDPHDKILEVFYDRALERLLLYFDTPLPHWKSIWPGTSQNIWQQSSAQFGLSISWGLLHADSLRDPSIPPNESAWDEKRRQAAHRAEAERISQEYTRLSQEATL